MGKAGSSACHSEHGATRSESEINMLAGGKHTAIQRRRVEESVPLLEGVWKSADGQWPPLHGRMEFEKTAPSKEGAVQVAEKVSFFAYLSINTVGALTERPVILRTKSHRYTAIIFSFYEKIKQFACKLLAGDQ